MEQRTQILILSGPTATGKTEVSVALAERLGGEIVSADSMQVYRGFDIASAKPDLLERGGIPHHMLDVVEPSESFSVADYLAGASAAIDDIAARGRLPVVTGGTWLYISALVDGLRLPPIVSDNALRHTLEREAQEGIDTLIDYLQKHDPESAARLHRNDKKRIVRAVEVHRLTGEPLSEWARRSRAEPPPYDAQLVFLHFTDRERLYERIDSRVDRMLERGLLCEARTQYERRDSLSRTATGAIGYKELFPYFEGREPLPDCIETLKRETRRYSKRQLTFMKPRACALWIARDNRQNSEIVQEITKSMEKFGNC